MTGYTAQTWTQDEFIAAMGLKDPGHWIGEILYPAGRKDKEGMFFSPNRIQSFGLAPPKGGSYRERPDIRGVAHVPPVVEEACMLWMELDPEDCLIQDMNPALLQFFQHSLLTKFNAYWGSSAHSFISSGGKSVHAFWKIDATLDLALWAETQALLIVAFETWVLAEQQARKLPVESFWLKPDTVSLNPSALSRLGGWSNLSTSTRYQRVIELNPSWSSYDLRMINFQLKAFIGDPLMLGVKIAEVKGRKAASAGGGPGPVFPAVKPGFHVQPQAAVQTAQPLVKRSPLISSREYARRDTASRRDLRAECPEIFGDQS